MHFIFQWTSYIRKGPINPNTLLKNEFHTLSDGEYNVYYSHRINNNPKIVIKGLIISIIEFKVARFDDQ